MQRHLAAALAAAAFACADGGDTAKGGPDDDSGTTDSGLPAPEGDPATVALDGTCPMASDLGGFVVEEHADYTIVDGAVLDGVVPISVLTEETVEGDCRVLRRENPHCDPLCASDETCTLEGECIPFPLEQGLGTVTVAGLVADVIMEPRGPGARYFDTGLPHPGITPGALIELRTGADGALGAISLHAVGPAPLEGTDAELVLSRGAPLAVSWTPPDPGARTQVALTLAIDQHGASPLSIHCLFDDDGSAEVPAALTDALVAGGVTGFPSASLQRRTADRADVGGQCIDLVAASRRPIPLAVDGFTPCTDDEDCPEGLECNEAIELCQ